MNAWEMRGLLQELIDENPFAIRAMLKIVRVEFTDEVPTLAVTAEAQPRLKINLGFVAQHCRTPEQVKAVLCHEFLHVLLRHTSLKGPLTPARHLALDAAINAIIHRQLGPAYSSLMSEYYAKQQGLGVLLPTNLMVCFELQKPQPDVPKLTRRMRRYLWVIASQGAMQVMIILIMARFAMGV